MIFQNLFGILNFAGHRGFRDTALDGFLHDFRVKGEQLIVPQARQHPQQCGVRQSVLRISAADIGMDAGKPDLLQHLIGRGAYPDRWLEIAAPFVHGQRLKGVIDMLPELGVVERIGCCADPAPRNSERTDGVPYADALDLDLLAAFGCKRVENRFGEALR